MTERRSNMASSGRAAPLAAAGGNRGYSSHVFVFSRFLRLFAAKKIPKPTR